jgi:hypothetical protein
MPLKKLADDATEKIAQCVPGGLGAEARAQIAAIVEQAIIDAVEHVHERYEGVVKAQAGPEADIAHKIAQHMKQERTAFVANLSAMR